MHQAIKGRALAQSTSCLEPKILKDRGSADIERGGFLERRRSGDAKILKRRDLYSNIRSRMIP